MFCPGTLDGYRLSHARHAFCLFLKGRDGGMRLQKLQTSWGLREPPKWNEYIPKKIDTQKVYPGTPGVGALAALRRSPGGTKGFLGNTLIGEGEYPLVRGVPMKFNASGGGRCRCRRPVLWGAFRVHLELETRCAPTPKTVWRVANVLSRDPGRLPT